MRRRCVASSCAAACLSAAREVRLWLISLALPSCSVAHLQVAGVFYVFIAVSLLSWVVLGVEVLVWHPAPQSLLRRRCIEFCGGYFDDAEDEAQDERELTSAFARVCGCLLPGALRAQSDGNGSGAASARGLCPQLPQGCFSCCCCTGHRYVRRRAKSIDAAVGSLYPPAAPATAGGVVTGARASINAAVSGMIAAVGSAGTGLTGGGGGQGAPAPLSSQPPQHQQQDQHSVAVSTSAMVSVNPLRLEPPQ